MANQLLNVTRIWRHSVRLMNERQSFHDFQYDFPTLLELSRIVTVKTLTNPYRWETVKFELS